MRYNLLIGMVMKKEAQTIEFKRSWYDEYLIWLYGFANVQGGKSFASRMLEEPLV